MVRFLAARYQAKWIRLGRAGESQHGERSIASVIFLALKPSSAPKSPQPPDQAVAVAGLA